MKKIIPIIALTAFLIILLPVYQVKAVTYDDIMDYNNVLFVSYYIESRINANGARYDPGYYNFYCVSNNNNMYVAANNDIRNFQFRYYIEGANSEVNFEGTGYSQSYDVNLPLQYALNKFAVVIKGSVSSSGTIPFYESLDDYMDTVNPSHWYDDFIDWWDGKLFESELEDIWDWIKSFFVDDDVPNIDYLIVTPAPTPTPIPYEVQIRTDPVTNNTSIVYVYNDTNNNTVVSNEPPAPYNPLPVTIGTGLGTGNSSDTGPQYYTNTDPIGLPDLDWLNFDLDFDGNLISTLAGFGSGVDTINNATNEYNSGIENIFSIFLQIPQDIYFVIGLALSVILIAGIINRFLS